MKTFIMRAYHAVFVRVMLVEVPIQVIFRAFNAQSAGFHRRPCLVQIVPGLIAQTTLQRPREIPA